MKMIILFHYGVENSWTQLIMQIRMLRHCSTMYVNTAKFFVWHTL